MNDRVITGHIDPWWDDSYKNLDYKYYPLKNSVEDIERWNKQGYSAMTLNGGLYDMRRPFPDMANKFFTLFEWANIGVSFYCMKTCDFLPLHTDHYITYRERFNITDPNRVKRAIVFLEDWKSGHYFEIKGIPMMPWKAGDWVAWDFDCEHAAGNIGPENRYTVQITGYIDGH